MESKLVSAINKTLKELEGYNLLSFIRNNTGMAKRGKCYIHFGKVGSADFIVFLKKGETVFIECKDVDGIQSPDQIKFQKLIELLGHKYFLIVNYQEFEKIIFPQKKNCRDA